MNGFARCAFLAAIATATPALAEPISIGGQRQLWVDRQLLDPSSTVQLVMGHPQPQDIALNFDQPWEKAANYVSVLKDGAVYRMYYRGCTLKPNGDFDPTSEATCYAESPDGVHWTKPQLGLHAFAGSTRNNIILGSDPRRISSNFAPFLDARPGVPASERFKAVGGLFNDNSGIVPVGPNAETAGGLYRLVSADGIHWRVSEPNPIFAGYALDSLNCPSWIPSEGVYAIYLRTWSEGGTPDQPAYHGYRTISRSVSRDFITWSKPERMDFGSSPPENLYTNGTHVYFREPSLLISLAFRFSPERQVISSADEARYGLHPTQARGVSDAVLMTSRGGNHYDRTFLESFIRPGPDPRSWTARSNAPARGIVPTGDTEMSIYLVTHYTMPTCRLQRYSLRLDGFASAHGDFNGGVLLTQPFRFTGNRLVLNYAASSVGHVRVEVLSVDGQVLPGFSDAENPEIVGDEIEHVVRWKSSSVLAALQNQPIRLRFSLKDADLYSFQFQP